MGIVDEDIARVRQATDIVAVITGRVQLRKVGQRWVGVCPFHSEKSPSFSVNAAEGLYHCFGCKASGDAITFVRETEHLDFAGAVEFLAHKAGIQLRYTDSSESESRKKSKAMLDLMERATEFYHEQLLTSPGAGPARSYLRGRGFDREMVDHYRLGWAPDTWDALCRALRIDGAKAESIGLGFTNRVGRTQDFFRARVLFPIADDQGRTVAFGGRKLPGAEGAKYQNSRENQLYHKSRTLYGLHWAKAGIVRDGSVVICEGYTDVIGMHTAGIERAVATCGTALTEEHLKVLKKYTDKIVLAYDADQAGQTAAERIFAWERSLGLELSVVDLPEGSDPGEMAASDPEGLAERVEHARPFLAFRVDRALANAELDSPERRLRSARAAAELVNEHPDAAVRRAFLDEIATRTRTEAADLAGVRAAPSGDRSRGDSSRRDHGPGERSPGPDFDQARPVQRPARRPTRPVPPRELEAIAVALEDPDLLGWYPDFLMRHPTSAEAIRAMIGGGALSEMVERAESPEAAAVLTHVAAGNLVPGDAFGMVREGDLPDPEELHQELILAAAQVELERLTKRASFSDGEQDFEGAAEVALWTTTWVQRLRHSIAEQDRVGARDAADTLLAWLRDLSAPAAG